MVPVIFWELKFDLPQQLPTTEARSVKREWAGSKCKKFLSQVGLRRNSPRSAAPIREPTMAAKWPDRVLRKQIYRRLTESARDLSLESEAEFVAIAAGLRGQAKKMLITLAEGERTSAELRHGLSLTNPRVTADRVNKRLALLGDRRRIESRRTPQGYLWSLEDED